MYLMCPKIPTFLEFVTLGPSNIILFIIAILPSGKFGKMFHSKNDIYKKLKFKQR